jgi:HEAT repeat protein
MLALSDQAPEVRQAAARALGRIGGDAVVAALIAALKDEDINVRHEASAALFSVGPEAVPAAISTLSDPDPGIRFLAANILISFKSDAVAPLIVQLKDENSSAQSEAYGILIQIGAPAVPSLIAEIEDETSAIKSKVEDILAQIGRPALKSLKRVLKVGARPAKKAAADIMGRIGDDAAVDPLVTALLDLEIARSAAEALQALGWQPAFTPDKVHFLLAMGKKEAVLSEWQVNEQILIADLRSEEPAVVEYAAVQLIELGGKQMIPRMLEIMKKDESRRMAMAFLQSEHAALRSGAQKWLKR